MQSLSLNDVKGTEAGLKELVALKNLQPIRLHGVSVTDAGLRELPRVKSLRELYLSGTNSTGGISALRKALSACTMVVLS